MDTNVLLAALISNNGASHVILRLILDEGDNLVFECAFTSSSDYLITSNVRDFNNGEWQGAAFTVLTPRQFCQQWRSRHE
ncbi:MAG: hypothetical protein R3E95_20200 [Thiolinea sp.]